MKKILFLACLPVVLLVSGCSFTKNNETNPIVNTPIVQNSVCEIPVVASSTEVNTKTGLPPVSQEEKNKTFTYEDAELGVKMKYPGSCYFNKGVFQCSDFTLSIWLLDAGAKISSTPEKTYASGETQIKYTYSNGDKIYALMAWYDGEDKADLDNVIDNISKTITFSK